MQALYRKYRPKIFDEIRGQRVIVQTLKNQVKEKTYGHAYLFSGTRGTGKTSAAKILARAINCENPVEGNPCNQCPTCLGILEERILDVVEMDAASNNSVDDIRELKDNAIYPPSFAEKKVYIIDEVHMLSKGAFNALLKILEEPPAHVVFILATTEPEKIPPTITSRTQKFRFQRLKMEDIVADLEEVLEKEGLPFEESALRLIASHSDGAMRDALSILDQTMGVKLDALTEEEVKITLGLTDIEILQRIFDALINRDGHFLLELIEGEYLRGKNLSLFLETTMGYCRDLLVTKTTGKPPVVYGEKEGKVLLEQGNEFSSHQLFSFIQILSKSLGNFRYSEDKKLLCEVTFLTMLSLEEKIGESYNDSEKFSFESPIKANSGEKMGLIKEEEKPSKGVASSKEMVSETRKKDSKEILNKNSNDDIIEKPMKKESNIANYQEFWEQMKNSIRGIRPNIFALLRDASLDRIENGVLYIAFEEGYTFHKEAIMNPSNKKVILEVAQGMDSTIEEVKSEISQKNSQLDRVLEAFGAENIEIID
ncbi:DNA polymerase III subunit gamma/tau [Peptoniphilus sp. KCTC 25270]|uniref:DNA polymerase III subunit gamma/tau n=1 Tax=Peptoniphilus sp. KCTC 25270 TaxID=2897414 RepID=UPI001E57671F|nr:DNA polymerase III subunit gamma/tau [Peptoniphilus sp. KCTC 25270]MCD1146881.1 DNA polymerase III subunit gamma/tau [Peptoniphilus sp. KCTC 25270]